MFIGAIIVLAGVFTQALCTTVQVFIGARVLSKTAIHGMFRMLILVWQLA